MTLILSMIGGCQQQQDPTSAEGIKLCNDQLTGFSQTLTASQRHQMLRECLRDADERLGLERKHLEKQAEEDKAREKLQKPTHYASANELIKFCTFNSGQLSELLKSYYQISGEIARRSYSGQGSSDELNSLTKKLKEIELQAASQIPESYRIGKPLLPDALALLARCNQSEISSLAR